MGGGARARAEDAGDGKEDASSERWILYGAYGFTGSLLAREAVRRGHVPVLAGRDPERLQALARELDLEAMPASLEDPAALDRLLEGAALVLHAAGPFVHTTPPMLEACLRNGAHYLDLTGEITVFELVFERDQEARRRGVLLVPGVGLDVAATDCLALRLQEALPDATELELAFSSPGGASPGTMRTMLEHLPAGVLARRDGTLVHLPMGTGAKPVPFHDRTRTVVPVPWGDLVSAWRSTGIGTITTYSPLGIRPAFLRVVGPAARLLLTLRPLRRAVQGWTGRRGNSAAERGEDTRTRLWGSVRNPAGKSRELRLETLQGYRFTAAAGILAVEEVLGGRVRPEAGALTPGMAFGAGFVDRVPETRWPDGAPSGPPVP